MTMNDFSSDTPCAPTIKKPYEKPSFRYEQVFVTTALTCGKQAGSQGDCLLNPKNS
jgi:hypothetical protein